MLNINLVDLNNLLSTAHDTGMNISIINVVGKMAAVTPVIEMMTNHLKAVSRTIEIFVNILNLITS